MIFRLVIRDVNLDTRCTQVKHKHAVIVNLTYSFCEQKLYHTGTFLVNAQAFGLHTFWNTWSYTLL